MSALRFLAASSAMMGQHEAATKALTQLLALDPTLRVSNLKDMIPLRRPVDARRPGWFARWIAAKRRRAAVPDRLREREHESRRRDRGDPVLADAARDDRELQDGAFARVRH